jgi:hypothetical protein
VLQQAVGDPDLTDCPPALLPVVTDCVDPDPARRSAVAELQTRLADVAGQRPRSWLPAAVAARFAEYLQFPEPAPAHRTRFRYLRRSASPGGQLPGRLRAC